MDMSRMLEIKKGDIIILLYNQYEFHTGGVQYTTWKSGCENFVVIPRPNKEVIARMLSVWFPENNIRTNFYMPNEVKEAIAMNYNAVIYKKEIKEYGNDDVKKKEQSDDIDKQLKEIKGIIKDKAIFVLLCDFKLDNGKALKSLREIQTKILPNALRLNSDLILRVKHKKRFEIVYSKDKIKGKEIILE